MRENASGSYHPCGTCKMGINPMAVVDPDLKVIGIEGLRVVDSSIIPQIPSCNLNAISMAIGEKGADLNPGRLRVTWKKNRSAVLARFMRA